MTPAEAAQLLELPGNATAEQVEARFLDLSRRLEGKVTKAPTPGLQAKYRETLALITTAFETLTLAADADSLPALRHSPSPSPTEAPAKAGSGEKHPSPAPAATAVTRPGRIRLTVRIGTFVALLTTLAISLWLRHLAATTDESTASADTDSTSEMPHAEAQRAGWAGLDAEDRLANVRRRWDYLAELATQYEAYAAKHLELYRNASDRPDAQQAELWARAQAHTDGARKLRKAVAPGGSLARAKRELEALIARKKTDSYDAYTKFDGEMDALIIDEPDGYLQGAVVITSDPPGLQWTIESSYGGGRTLRVSGVTPTDKPYLYLGSGNGTLRIQHPGKPDFVVPLKNLGNSGNEPVKEHAIFN